MPGKHGLRALLALAAAGVAVSGCGSDELNGEIPAGNATQLDSALASLRSTIEDGSIDCDQAPTQAQAFLDAVNRLPADPSGELKPPLQDAAENLRGLVDAECPDTDTSGSPTTTSATTSETTDTTSTETTTTDTDTTTTDTTTTDTTTTTSQTQPGNGNGNGSGTGGTSGGTNDDKDG